MLSKTAVELASTGLRPALDPSISSTNKSVAHCAISVLLPSARALLSHISELYQSSCCSAASGRPDHRVGEAAGSSSTAQLSSPEQLPRAAAAATPQSSGSNSSTFTSQARTYSTHACPSHAATRGSCSPPSRADPGTPSSSSRVNCSWGSAWAPSSSRSHLARAYSSAAATGTTTGRGPGSSSCTSGGSGGRGGATTTGGGGGGSSSPAGGGADSSSSSGSSGPGVSRSGYGGKVSVPVMSVLQEPLVSQPARVSLRAHHLGARIHIGVLAKEAEQRGYRVNAGKDYAIIWLDPEQQQQQQQHQPPAEGGGGGPQPAWEAAAAAAAAAAGESAAEARPAGAAGLGRFDRPATQAEQAAGRRDGKQAPHMMVAYRYGSVVFLGGAASDDPRLIHQALSHPGLLYLSREDQQQQQQQPDNPAAWVQPRPEFLGELLLQRWSQQVQWHEMEQKRQALQEQQWQQQQQQQGRQQSGEGHQRPGDASNSQQQQQNSRGDSSSSSSSESYNFQVLQKLRRAQQQAVKLALLSPFWSHDWSWLLMLKSSSQQQQQQDSEWLGPPPSFETLEVLVDPLLGRAVEKGKDELRVKVLDIGNLRVISSTMAQSVALDSYSKSVDRSLEAFQAWKAEARARRRAQSWEVTRLLEDKHDRMLFRVIAGAALVITECRSLLEMVEPAWQYDAYHDTWKAMAGELELERRCQVLAVKLHQVEEEAKFDVEVRHGRRYHNLSKAVEILLYLSVAMALWELGKAVIRRLQQQQEEEAAALQVLRDGAAMAAGDDGTKSDELLHEHSAAWAVWAADSGGHGQGQQGAAAEGEGAGEETPLQQPREGVEEEEEGMGQQDEGRGWLRGAWRK